MTHPPYLDESGSESFLALAVTGRSDRLSGESIRVRRTSPWTLCPCLTAPGPPLVS